MAQSDYEPVDGKVLNMAVCNVIDENRDLSGYSIQHEEEAGEPTTLEDVQIFQSVAPEQTGKSAVCSTIPSPRQTPANLNLTDKTKRSASIHNKLIKRQTDIQFGHSHRNISPWNGRNLIGRDPTSEVENSGQNKCPTAVSGTNVKVRDQTAGNSGHFKVRNQTALAGRNFKVRDQVAERNGTFKVRDQPFTGGRNFKVRDQVTEGNGNSKVRDPTAVNGGKARVRDQTVGRSGHFKVRDQSVMKGRHLKVRDQAAVNRDMDKHENIQVCDPQNVGNRHTKVRVRTATRDSACKSAGVNINQSGCRAAPSIPQVRDQSTENRVHFSFRGQTAEQTENANDTEKSNEKGSHTPIAMLKKVESGDTRPDKESSVDVQNIVGSVDLKEEYADEDGIESSPENSSDADLRFSGLRMQNERDPDERGILAYTQDEVNGFDDYDDSCASSIREEDYYLINRVSAVSMRVPVFMMERELEAVIDTGAEVTVLNQRIFDQLPPSTRPIVKKADRGLVVAERGKKMGSHGMAVVKFKIGDQDYEWTMYIADIGDDILLGADFLDRFDMTVNFKRGLLVNEKWVACQTRRRPNVVNQLYIEEKTTIPGEYEMIIPTVKDEHFKSSDDFFMLEPALEDKVDVVVARILVDTRQAVIPVRCANPGKDPVVLEKGQIMGELDLVKPLLMLPGDEMAERTSPLEPELLMGNPDLVQLRGVCQLSEEQSEAPSVNIPREWEPGAGLNNEQKSPVQPLSASDKKRLLKRKRGQQYKTRLLGMRPRKRKRQVAHISEVTESIPLELPEHLHELYKRSCKQIPDPKYKELLVQFLVKHQNAFAKNGQELGCCNLIKHKINTGLAAPVRQAFRRTPQGFEQEEEKYLKEQLEQGVLVPSKSPWAAAVVLVRKKDNSTRWCGDFRAVNERTLRDAHPLPRIDMCLDCLAGSELFSTMDLQAGYHQIQMAEEDQEKTAIITKYGLFQYTVMPFGLVNAPMTFQRCMQLIFRGLQWNTLLIYLDDLIVYSGKNYQEHFRRLDEVLTKLTEAGLKLKPKKCDFLQTEVLFLGHVIGKDGVRPNPELVEKIRQWPEPPNMKEVQRILGLMNYYRRFVYKHSDIAAPLVGLTKKGVKFTWGDREQRAFDQLKTAMCTAPILAFPTAEGQFIIDTDASDVGVGCVLSQVQNGEERVIAYGSKTLSKEQSRYCVTRRELLAIVVFLLQYRHYLLGREFLVRSDHSSLQWLFSFKQPHGQLARWLEFLSQYTFQIEHRAGKKHTNADTLSRTPENHTVASHHDMAKHLPCKCCPYCERHTEEWSEYEEKVNDVVPLSKGAKGLQCLQVITRAQKTGKQSVANVNVRPSGKSDPVIRGTPNSNDDTYLCPTESPRSGGSSVSATKNNRADDPVRPALNHPGKVTRSMRNAADDPHRLDHLWLAGHSRQEIQQLQREDPDLKYIHLWLDQGELPSRDKVDQYSPAVRCYYLNWSKLKREEGVVYQTWFHDIEGQPSKIQLLTPRVLRQEVMHQCHNAILGGHLGIKKTLQKIKDRFYWYGITMSVKGHIQTCRVCSANSKPNKKYRAALGAYRVGNVMDLLGIDIMGPLPVSRTGCKYILVIGDYASRWIEAYGLPDQQAETVAHKLVHDFIARFGVPLQIHSDQGRNFESFLFAEVCRLLQITKTRSTPYHPCSNGLVERHNRTLARMIRSFLDNNQENWDIYLPLLTAAYRSTIHPATGFSPNMMMLGREVRLPVDLLFPVPETEMPVNTAEYVVQLRARLEKCYDFARQYLQRASERQKHDYDTRLREQRYQPGDLVYRHNPNSKKLETPWLGPQVVTKKLSDVVYRVVNRKKSTVIHHDQLKPYPCAFVPGWARKIQRSLTSPSQS